MRTAIFLLGGKFCGGNAFVGKQEIRIVAKAALAAWRIDDFAMPLTFGDERLRIIGTADEY